MTELFRPKNSHVYVRPPHLPTEHQGFVVAWHKLDDGSWAVRVIYLHPQTGEEVRVEVTPDRVRPVDSAPFTGSAYG